MQKLFGMSHMLSDSAGVSKTTKIDDVSERIISELNQKHNMEFIADIS